MKSLLLIFLVLVSIFAQAQQPTGRPAQGNPPTPMTLRGTGKISGNITDASNQQPVEFATVALTLPNSEKPIDGAICDDKGKFSIHKVPNGTYRLIISFIGYKNEFVDKIVISDKKNRVDAGIGREAARRPGPAAIGRDGRLRHAAAGAHPVRHLPRRARSI